MGVRYDRSSWSVVVVCSCGWREIAATQDGAWRTARDHEAREHPNDYRVRRADAARRRRVHPPECDGTGSTLEP